MTPKPKNPGGGKPSQTHGGVNASAGIASAQNATGQAAQAGKPGAAAPTTPGTNQPPPAIKPIQPPDSTTISHNATSEAHIINGDGGRQGGHLAGTGFSNKTEFPSGWDRSKILDASYQVTQQGPPVKGPYLTKDADGNPRWAYNYEGRVDGVEIRTTVFADGEIRTAFPVNSADPGVITNPPAPNPAPKGVPQSTPPRYSHPDVGGDGSWTWEGPKGNREIRVVHDANGNVTTTDLGPRK